MPVRQAQNSTSTMQPTWLLRAAGKIVQQFPVIPRACLLGFLYNSQQCVSRDGAYNIAAI